MVSFAHAYAYLLFGNSRPVSPAAADPLDSLLTRLIAAPIESLARRRRLKSADDTPATAAPAVPLRALDGGRDRQPAAQAPCSETLRPAA